jgi:hypothetical protein
MLDLLDATGGTGGCELLPAARQMDGVLQEGAQGLQERLLLGRDNVLEVLAAAEQVAVPAALGDFEHVVAVQTVHHQVAIKIGAEDVFGGVVAAAGAEGIDGHVRGADDPQPGVAAAEAPAGLVGLDDVTLP